jgi:hypothetical protein
MITCPICGYNAKFLSSKTNRFGDKYEYFICTRCRFLFEQDLSLNSTRLENKVSKIYQDDYFQRIDSGWEMRGDAFIKIVKKVIRIFSFFKIRKNPSVLDYGGGNGYIASKLAENFSVFYYDKYEKPSIRGNYRILDGLVKADIIYAVELVEHITDIKEWDFLKKLSPSVFIFTTGLSDNIKDKEIINWSYLDSDAGHMALYSTESLYLLGKKYGFIYIFFPNISCHIFLKNKFLSNYNFVKLEYFIYSFFRKIKYLFK